MFSFFLDLKLPLRCIYKKNREARDMYVNVENVNFAYDKKPILHDINFGMNKGEITGLIGPNGAGKSTMLKLMIKKMKPNNSKIIIGDNDIFSIKRENNPVTFANYAQTECQFRYCGTAIPFLTVRSTAR